MAHYLVTFTVKGHRHFPVDMLRYDSCHPADPEAVDGILEDTPAAREVRLNLIAFSKDVGPTTARWASFGWQVTDVRRMRV